MIYKSIIFNIACTLLMAIQPAGHLTAQPKAINFKKLTVQQGLNDGMVNAMTQDAHGYMWFASMGGLNRFDGKTVKRFLHRPGDSNSLLNSVPYALAASGRDTLWVGYFGALQMFNSRTGQCRTINAFDKLNIYNIIPLPDRRILVHSPQKITCYNPANNKLEPLLLHNVKQTIDLRQTKVFSVSINQQELLLGTENAVVMVDLAGGNAKLISLPGGSGRISHVGTDSQGDIWALNVKTNNIWCIRRKTGEILSFDWLLKRPGETRLATMLMMTAAGKPDIWIGTLERGLIGYNTISGQTTYQQHEPERPQSLSADIIRQLYQAPDATLWLNTMHGIDYFEPGVNLFERFMPYASSADPGLGRGVYEDRKGNLWLTSLRGISCYDPHLGTYKSWRNESSKPTELYSNSVRAIVEDELGRIWIATANGVNRLNPTSGKIEFLTRADGLPEGFYFSASKDRSGRIWFGTRDNDGFYYYDPADKKLHSIADIPALKTLAGNGGRYAFEDSRQRLWFGFNGDGLAMYDGKKGQLKRWGYQGNLNDSAIANDLVIDIKEDRRGIIWVTSFGGIDGIDVEKNKVLHFTPQNGLKSNIAGPVAVDDSNRVWVGTSAGLLMINSARTSFRYFGEEDGLPVVEMPEHPSLTTANGDIIMPTVNGYIRYNPLHYYEKHRLIPCYVSGVTLFNSSDSVRFHSSTLKLRPHENFFTIGLVAINYKNPSQTWYAFKLEGFDKEWRYTQDAKAVYTNVPGGHYRFLYKASFSKDLWNETTGELDIVIGTVFYKAFWFWPLCVLVAAALLYSWYNKKIARQQQWMLLQNKAQALEKEKTLVMYESLKQQLNPHFLFNSLTSLESLIETDQRLAGKFLAGMSKIYRYILQSNDSELVTIKDDLDMMQVYVRLQQTRFEKGLEIEEAVRKEDLSKKIPPVTLQNLVENAIKHNIIDEDSPLIIHIASDGEYLVVSNNLQKKKKVETSNKRGLSSLTALYKYLSNKPLQIDETEETFTLRLPLIS